ncbi:Undecaprenyl-phosphate mannosyltransferase [Polystyrenella longa]|uniref:Undecaprenyl-phosphate mannosyltransferase n=1 Tax=Polystyrenella longa TaxID=2528007 RepID=A0A518CR21_9PLAN|nr:polyprenol monophosphomannose synthase [Polystyrenella longa]QDU81686.1 Undecaprenyl-phosphate mannosyltransferase [Polystyrenella longa]
MNRRILITLCTYNERENLEQLIPEIRMSLPEAHILVVDDKSPDGTGALVKEMQQDNPALFLIERSGKQGLGTATVAAFRWGIEKEFDYLINMDADFSHPPRYLPDLVKAMDDADVAIASRYVEGGEIEGWGLKRHLMSRGINCYARLLLRLKTKDNSGSYRCYRVSRLAELDFDKIVSRGYAFQEEILYRCNRIDCRFVEVPFLFEERRHGSSKINGMEAVTALGNLFRLGMENVLRVDVRRDQN